jgi:hypothetical protein
MEEDANLKHWGKLVFPPPAVRSIPVPVGTEIVYGGSDEKDK